MNDQQTALLKALRDLSRLVDEDVPLRNRSTKLQSSLAYAFELVEVMEELPVRRYVEPDETITYLSPSEAIREFAQELGWEVNDLNQPPVPEPRGHGLASFDEFYDDERTIHLKALQLFLTHPLEPKPCGSAQS